MSSSTTPSSSTVSRIVSISSSVTVSSLSFSFQMPDSSFKNRSRSQISGNSKSHSAAIGSTTSFAKPSARSAAKIFGRISPKVMISTVMIAVATHAPLSPISAIANAAAIDDEPMFTRLFPIRIAMSPESNRSRKRSASFASLLPFSSASCFSFVGFSCMNAISAPENMAESTMQTTIRI